MPSDLHLYRKSIERDLVNKLSYTEIAKKYYTTKGVVAGFIDRHLKEFKRVKLNKLIDKEQCKYPFGDPKAKNYRLCKNKVKLDSVYCDVHHDKCYIKPPPLKY